MFRERLHRIGEEHRTGAADRDVERCRRRRGAPGRPPARTARWSGRPRSASRRATSSMPRRGRCRAAAPPGARPAAARVVCPVPQPMSSTRSSGADAGRVEERPGVPGHGAVELVGVRGPVGRPRCRPRRATARGWPGATVDEHPRAVTVHRPRIVPLGSCRTYSQGERMSRIDPDDDVVRDPRSAGRPAVEHLRADPPDGPQPGPDLAAGRRASSTRSRRSWSTHGLAEASAEPVGPAAAHRLHDHPGRPAGARRTGCASPGAGPVLEFEQLLKVFFADSGTRTDALASIAAARRWAEERNEENLARRAPTRRARVRSRPAPPRRCLPARS